MERSCFCESVEAFDLGILVVFFVRHYFSRIIHPISFDTGASVFLY